MVRLEQVLESWKTVRADTAQALLDMPGGEMDFKPAPELMSFGDIARHILNAGRGLARMILEGEQNLAVPGARERMAKHFPTIPEAATPGELAAALNQAVAEDCAELARKPGEFFAEVMTRFDGQRVTRLEMLQFTKEHELTHRSQMFVYLRLKGVVPPTTRRRQAKQ